MLIDGSSSRPQGGRTYDNVNPATEEVIGPVADASPADMERAIAAARRAFDETDWSTDRAFRKALPPAAEGRARQAQGRAAAADRRRGRHADRPHVRDPAGHLHRRHAVGHRPDRSLRVGVRARQPRVLRHDSNRLVVREPIGVVGAITPWNFPFMLNLSKITPALAAGCTVVLKPAPDTPYAATWIGKLVAEETDIPAGVFNVVTVGRSRPTVGDVLTGSPRVDMISFTGSTAVGKHIAARGADTLKRVFLELGGKSANIVLDDADFADGAAGRGHGVHALRPGLRDHHPPAAAALALRRGRRDGEGRVRELPVRRPDRPRQHGRAR